MTEYGTARQSWTVAQCTRNHDTLFAQTFAWTEIFLKGEPLVNQVNQVNVWFLFLTAVEWRQRGPLWWGSSEDKGCIEAREKG